MDEGSVRADTSRPGPVGAEIISDDQHAVIVESVAVAETIMESTMELAATDLEPVITELKTAVAELEPATVETTMEPTVVELPAAVEPMAGPATVAEPMVEQPVTESMVEPIVEPDTQRKSAQLVDESTTGEKLGSAFTAKGEEKKIKQDDEQLDEIKGTAGPVAESQVHGEISDDEKQAPLTCDVRTHVDSPSVLEISRPSEGTEDGVLRFESARVTLSVPMGGAPNTSSSAPTSASATLGSSSSNVNGNTGSTRERTGGGQTGEGADIISTPPSSTKVGVSTRASAKEDTLDQANITTTTAVALPVLNISFDSNDCSKAAVEQVAPDLPCVLSSCQQPADESNENDYDDESLSSMNESKIENWGAVHTPVDDDSQMVQSNSGMSIEGSEGSDEGDQLLTSEEGSSPTGVSRRRRRLA